MIISFKHKGLEVLYKTGSAKGVLPAHAPRLKLLLAALDAARTPESLNLPSLRLHMLKGNYKGFYSITVSGNWRLIFRFIDANVELVNYLDYH